MWYSRRTTFLFVAALTLFAGCKKNDAGPAGPAPGPEAPTAPAGDTTGGEAAQPEEPVDLTDYLIRATMTLPKGTRFQRVRVLAPYESVVRAPVIAYNPTEQERVRSARRRNAKSESDYYVLTQGPRFEIELGKVSQPLTEVRAEMRPRVVTWIKEEPNLLIAEVQREKGTSFEFEARVQLAGETYRVRDGSGQYSKADIERMVRATTSLTENPNAREAQATEIKAREALNNVGCEVTEAGGGRKLVIAGDRVTDADLLGVRDIAGITEVVFSGAPRVTPKGLEALAACRRILDLRLSGPGVTDELVAPLAKLTTPNRVSLDGTSVSDLGLQFLAGYRDLQTLGISAKKPATVNLNRSGFGSLKGPRSLKSSW